MRQQKSKNNESGTQNRKKILSAVSILCLIGLIIVGALLVLRWTDDLNEKKKASEVRENIESARINVEQADETNEPAAETAGETAPEVLPEMAQALAMNSDIIGILEVGADTCLYVTQGEDNDFYLNHNYLKEEDEAGAAFLDVRCQIEPRDTHWIIHGHDMLNGTIFGQLKDFRDLEYLKNHPLVYLTLTYEKEIYVPYAILDVNVDQSADNYFKITEWNFKTDEEFEAYTGYFKENSYFNIPVEIAPEDELLTLSTCSYVYSDSRLLIACRKLRENESEDEMKAIIQSVE